MTQVQLTWGNIEIFLKKDARNCEEIKAASLSPNLGTKAQTPEHEAELLPALWESPVENSMKPSVLKIYIQLTLQTPS